MATFATPEGTRKYAARFAGRAADGHFREQQGLWLSSLGIGRYLGEPDARTDQGWLRRLYHLPGNADVRVHLLVVALLTAFVPLVWVITVIGGCLAALAFGAARRGMASNLAIAILVPPLVLMPWTFQVATHPALLLLEAGVQAPGLATGDLPARSLMLLSPGGPGMPPFWVAGGLVVAALAALLLGKRRSLVSWVSGPLLR